MTTKSDLKMQAAIIAAMQAMGFGTQAASVPAVTQQPVTTPSKPVEIANMTRVTAMVNSFNDAYNSRDELGGKLSMICADAQKNYQGAVIPHVEAQAICDQLATLRGWSKATADARKSENLRVIGSYTVFPTAVNEVKKIHGACGWQEGVNLARLLVANKNDVAKAVEAYGAGRKPSDTTPKSRANSALRTWHNDENTTPAERQLITAAMVSLQMEMNKLTIKVKKAA